MKAAGKKATTEYILSIDVGTQSIRAILIDPSGKEHDIVKTPIEPYFSAQPGWAEQDPEYYWKTLCLTCKKLIARNRAKVSAIRGATITTQRCTMINLDENGKVLRPAIVWLDQRRAQKESWPNPLLKMALSAIKIGEVVDAGITDCEANWIRQNQPEIWEKTRKFLFLSGFLIHRLTGEYRDSTGNIVGYVPFDYKNFEWAKPSDLKWNMFPMDRDILPDLVHPSETLGTVSKKAAAATGLPLGLPLIAAAADKACEVLGSGCLSPEIACLSYGTTATVETTNSKYVEIVPFIPPYPSAVPGAYNTEVMIYRGFWMVSWFKREFGMREELIAKKKKISPEALFDKLVADIPPGSMGLVLQPYWSPGLKVPGPEAKGAVIGFGDVHTRVHIYRAILEGLAYALKEGMQRTEKRNGVKIERLRVSGGGSQSEVAMQLTADIFDLPAERPHTYETSALGAAIDAAVGLKIHPDFKTAVAHMTRIGKVFEPIAKNRDIYRALYERVYTRLYDRMKPLYDDIREITGYPPKR
ncbi:MAG: carbohydrate kinase [Spirochaetes bacterium]|nr:MAG: carbohydrate kinase [Spirochaetota bacterium]